MDEVVEFRLEPRLRMLQSAVYLLVALASIPVLVFARGDRLLPLLVWGALVVVLAVLIVGVNRARVVLAPADLTVTGVLGTRVLTREQVLGLTLVSGSVILGWQTQRGRREWPLFSLYTPGIFARLVPGAQDRRQQFLDRVNAWAASAPLPDRP